MRKRRICAVQLLYLVLQEKHLAISYIKSSWSLGEYQNTNFKITDISFFHDQIRDGNTNSLGALVAFENRKTALDLINRPQPTNILQQRAVALL